MKGLIQLIELKKAYTRNGIETIAINSINLKIYKNQVTAIIGLSGSGKSTLLSMIGTLESPTTGKIVIMDEEITNLKGDQLADFRFEHIGFVFQNLNLIPTLTAFENIISPFLARKSRIDYKKQALDLLNYFGLKEKKDCLPAQLSGGEQQRIAIARALINNPDWLIADEPTGSLDSYHADIFYDLFHQSKKEFGCGVIVATHDSVLANKADRIIEIKDGIIQGDKSKGEYI